MRIDGKVVIITGASEGIGAACAKAFRAKGAKLVLAARREEKLREAASPGDRIVPGDVTSEDIRERIAEAALAAFGRIDILINNAGAGMYRPSDAAPLDEVRRMYELNFFAPLGMIQQVVPAMKKQRSGCVVNVASIAGKVTLPWLTLYSTSKYALGSLTDGLRMELRRDGIHAMTVCPGYVSTRFQENILSGDVPGSVRAGNWFRITAEQCAEAIVKGVETEARTVVAPRSGWGFVIAERLFPKFVDRRLERIYFS